MSRQKFTDLYHSPGPPHFEETRLSDAELGVMQGGLCTTGDYSLEGFNVDGSENPNPQLKLELYLELARVTWLGSEMGVITVWRGRR